LIRPVQSLKHAKQLAGVVLIEADTVVTDKHNGVTALPGKTADLYLSLGSWLCELQRIRDEIHKNDSKHGPVTGDHGELRDIPPNAPVSNVLLMLADDIRHK